MIFSWRRRRAVKKSLEEVTIPSNFQCPISLDLMRDPVMISTGITYDRTNIETWIETGNRKCPVTNQALDSPDPIPNHAIRRMIQAWCVENKSNGVERIPTPRIPITNSEAKQIVSRISMAVQRGDRARVLDLVGKVRRQAKESDRNRRSIAVNGLNWVLGSAFRSLSAASVDQNGAVLEEILCALTLFFPLDGDAKESLKSKVSLESLVLFLKSGDLSVKKNAILVLREIISSSESDQNKITGELSEIEGAMEGILKLIKDPVCPSTTKASMIIIYQMVKNPDHKIIRRFSEMGLVSILLENLVDSDKSLCEKTMAVLDGICSIEEGREKAYENALTVPVLIKKMLRVSGLATELSVSVLWKLCENEKREGGGVILEALEVGAFQKVLLALQVGFGSDRSKEKVTKLLKLLNVYRGTIDCVDSMDFKDLKRPF